jgi:membrane associated rhomboid family serine protease
MSLTVVLSLFVAFGDRHGGPLFEWLSLRPADVWRGQVWRLVSWPFIESSPLALLFACLALYWFGGPLAQLWRSSRFLLVFGSMLVSAAVGTCLVALVDADVRASTYLGSWALTAGLVVAWGLTFPNNVVRIYLVLPIRGAWFAWGTVALTIVYAIYSGWSHFLPQLISVALAVAWFYRRILLARWSNARRSFEAHRRDVRRDPEERERRGVVVDLRTGEPQKRKDEDLN